MQLAAAAQSCFASSPTFCYGAGTGSDEQMSRPAAQQSWNTPIAMLRWVWQEVPDDQSPLPASCSMILASSTELEQITRQWTWIILHTGPGIWTHHGMQSLQLVQVAEEADEGSQAALLPQLGLAGRLVSEQGGSRLQQPGQLGQQGPWP